VWKDKAGKQLWSAHVIHANFYKGTWRYDIKWKEKHEGCMDGIERRSVQLHERVRQLHTCCCAYGLWPICPPCIMLGCIGIPRPRPAGPPCGGMPPCCGPPIGAAPAFGGAPPEDPPPPGAAGWPPPGAGGWPPAGGPLAAMRSPEGAGRVGSCACVVFGVV
jgi:hypothetical protein